MDRYTSESKICLECHEIVDYLINSGLNNKVCKNCYVKPNESNWEKYDRYTSLGISDIEARSDCFQY